MVMAMGFIRRHVPSRVDDWLYTHIDHIGKTSKSYIVEAITIIPMAAVVAWMILGGAVVLGMFALLLLFSARLQMLATIYHVCLATGEHKVEMRFMDELTYRLNRWGVGIRFYYVKKEDKIRLVYRTTLPGGARSKLIERLAMFLVLLNIMINLGWYYRGMTISRYSGIVLPDMIEEAKKEKIPLPGGR